MKMETVAPAPIIIPRSWFQLNPMSPDCAMGELCSWKQAEFKQQTYWENLPQSANLDAYLDCLASCKMARWNHVCPVSNASPSLPPCSLRIATTTSSGSSTAIVFSVPNKLWRSWAAVRSRFCGDCNCSFTTDTWNAPVPNSN